MRFSVLRDVLAHGRFFIWMLPFPPLHVMQVAAEFDRRLLHRSDRDSICNRCATLVTRASLDQFRLYHSVPGNALVSMIINARRIDWADRATSAGMPVLAVGPMVGQNGRATNFAE